MKALLAITWDWLGTLEAESAAAPGRVMLEGEAAVIRVERGTTVDSDYFADNCAGLSSHPLFVLSAIRVWPYAAVSDLAMT